MSLQGAEADRRIANIIRVGRVVSVNPGAATAVVSFGDLQSPALPVGQMRAGAIQFWWMPSAGEQVLVACQGGDIAQGVIVASIYAGNAPSSDGAVPMINLAGGKMIIDGTLEVTGDMKVDGKVEVGGAITAADGITAQGDVKGGSVSLNDHTHQGVEAGGDNSGAPNQ